MSFTVTGAVLGLTSTLAGCAGDDESITTNAGIHIDTVGGVIHVRSTGVAPGWRLDKVATITGGENDLGFERVRSVVADADGNVYVVDGGAAHIRVYDSTGHFGRSAGAARGRRSSAIYTPSPGSATRSPRSIPPTRASG